LQDELQLVPDRLRLTLGSKLEHNDFTGFELQPNARLLWTIDPRQTAWGAVSRAVRTPSQLEDDLQIVAPGASLIGDKDFESEVVIAYELGYRVQPVDWLSLDVATYYNDYKKLRSLEFTGSIFSEENKLKGQTYGVEVGSTWKVANWWTIRGAYTFLQIQLQTEPGSTDLSSEATTGNDPQNQVYVRSSMDITRHVDLDFSVRYVDALTNLQIPAYTAADVRLAWRPDDHLELAVVGQNLFDNQHPEFVTGGSRYEIQRGVYGTLTFQW
jgi:iron complex outermembrane receptor protein